jgi:Tfp pilus assembly protein PilF
MFDNFASADRLIAKGFDDAPRELKATIELARSALAQGQKGLALKELRAAERIVKEQNLTANWQAELYAAWAFYYLHMGEEREMYQAISKAIRLEPENALIAELRELLRKNGK